MKKILILHTAYIGDIILATPLISAIKDKYPECLIDFITIPACANLLEKDQHLNELIIFDKSGKHAGFKGLKSIINSTKQNNYDACICPHRSLRSAIIARYSNSSVRVGFNNSSWPGAFSHIVKYDQSLHEAQRNLSLLAILDIHSSNTRPRIFEDEEDKKKVDSLIKNKNINTENIIAIAPGSVWPTKRWPMDYFVKIINFLNKENIKSVLIGGKKDIQLCNTMAKELSGIYSLAGTMTLRQTKLFLTKCKCIISNDSAPLHLGLAADIPVFSIFGPTIADFGFAPIESNSFTIEKHLNCKPCGIHGSNKCPTKTFDCMEKISPEYIIKKLNSYLN